jgi:hypothetical protein
MQRGPIDERDDALWRGPFELDSPDTSAVAAQAELQH